MKNHLFKHYFMPLALIFVLFLTVGCNRNQWGWVTLDLDATQNGYTKNSTDGDTYRINLTNVYNKQVGGKLLNGTYYVTIDYSVDRVPIQSKTSVKFTNGNVPDGIALGVSVNKKLEVIKVGVSIPPSEK